MYIQIHTTVGELREQGVLEKFCELFHYNPNGVLNEERAVLTLSQANKIGLKLEVEQPQAVAPKKRTKKAKA